MFGEDISYKEMLHQNSAVLTTIDFRKADSSLLHSTQSHYPSYYETGGNLRTRDESPISRQLSFDYNDQRETMKAEILRSLREEIHAEVSSAMGSIIQGQERRLNGFQNDLNAIFSQISIKEHEFSQKRVAFESEIKAIRDELERVKYYAERLQTLERTVRGSSINVMGSQPPEFEESSVMDFQKFESGIRTNLVDRGPSLSRPSSRQITRSPARKDSSRVKLEFKNVANSHAHSNIEVNYPHSENQDFRKPFSNLPNSNPNTNLRLQNTSLMPHTNATELNHEDSILKFVTNLKSASARNIEAIPPSSTANYLQPSLPDPNNFFSDLPMARPSHYGATYTPPPEAYFSIPQKSLKLILEHQ